MKCPECECEDYINEFENFYICGNCGHEWDKEEANQCDGCISGMHRDVVGLHRDIDNRPVMICQEHKYKTK